MSRSSCAQERDWRFARHARARPRVRGRANLSCEMGLDRTTDVEFPLGAQPGRTLGPPAARLGEREDAPMNEKLAALVASHTLKDLAASASVAGATSATKTTAGDGGWGSQC